MEGNKMQASPLEKWQVERTARFSYDFARDGGAVGDITLDDDVLPDDALITRGMIHVKTALVGATATVALTVNTSEDILAATAITSFTLAAILDVVPVRTAATAIKTTTKKNLTMTIATAALTAGKFEVFLSYYMGW